MRRCASIPRCRWKRSWSPTPRSRARTRTGYEVVGEKVTCRLAQRPGSYVVLRYVRKVYKRKTDGVFSCSPAPPAVLEKSCADVSFLAGLLIDKFVYHLPLYRQHQRLGRPGSIWPVDADEPGPSDGGVCWSRSTRRSWSRSCRARSWRWTRRRSRRVERRGRRRSGAR